MSITTFQCNLNLIRSFAVRLNSENISLEGKKILLKNYANCLNLNLTDNMIEEVFNKLY